MSAHRYWSSADGRTTVDLAAVVFTEPEHHDGASSLSVSASAARSCWVRSEETTSFLAALSAWRESLREADRKSVEAMVKQEWSKDLSDAQQQLVDKFMRPIYDAVAADTEVLGWASREENRTKDPCTDCGVLTNGIANTKAKPREMIPMCRGCFDRRPGPTYAGVPADPQAFGDGKCTFPEDAEVKRDVVRTAPTIEDLKVVDEKKDLDLEGWRPMAELPQGVRQDVDLLSDDGKHGEWSLSEHFVQPGWGMFIAWRPPGHNKVRPEIVEHFRAIDAARKQGVSGGKT